MQLSDLKPKQSARIVTLKSTHLGFRQRLLSMGFTPGTILTVQHIAPLGDPIEILVRGTTLSLRRSEADLLMLSPIEGE